MVEPIAGVALNTLAWAECAETVPATTKSNPRLSSAANSVCAKRCAFFIINPLFLEKKYDCSI